MFKTTRRKIGLGLLLAIGVVTLVVVGGVGARPMLGTPPGSPVGLQCTLGPTFNLETGTGHIYTPDGNSILMWSYIPAGGAFQTPGPVLCVTQGAVVTINLTNHLGENVSIVFPGQEGVTTSGGVPGLFTAEAAAGGGAVSYSFVASQPGTYLYESGTNPHKQVQMGLYGAIIVYPPAGSNYAYNDATTEFDPTREYLLVLNEIDPNLHQAVELGEPYSPTEFDPDYWTVNGRSFPDTVSDNYVSWLPNQPYGSLVRIKAFSPGDKPALIRYLNAGSANHPFHPHANHMRVIARDGRLLRGPGGEDVSFEDFTRTIGSGQTYDLLFSWTDVDAWNPSGNPVPVTIPGLQNLVFKDDATFYSGSPYLGETGEFPVPIVSFSECGEFYFPWHSHALFEFTNFDEGFGGMATLLRVDPPGGCP
jgi:FtsP/CotA-like multicopper oxidase with cupredoxin domain